MPNIEMVQVSVSSDALVANQISCTVGRYDKALWLAVDSHMTSLNQSDCFIPA